MRFNLLKKVSKVVKNHEGERAYAINAETELYAAVVTAGLNDSFYEKAQSRLTRIRKLITQVDPEFTARLAVYSRNTMHMRSIPLVLTVELAKATTPSGLVKRTVPHVVRRADEITEMLAYYQQANERKDYKKLNRLSKQLQKGLAETFNCFDEYQFAKYNRKGMITLKDTLFLVHPKAKNAEQQQLFDRIAQNTLAIPYTWETELSALGKLQYSSDVAKKDAFRAKWEELIDSKKLGYMALLRNLRNILEAKVSYVHVLQVARILADEQAVRQSKQFPFRFLAAYRELKQIQTAHANLLMAALESAVGVSAQTIKGFDTSTSVLIACDVSGSMYQPVSARSRIKLYDIGLMMGMMMQSRCKTVVCGMFGDRWKRVRLNHQNVLQNVDAFYQREGEVGYSTNGYLVIEDLIQRREHIDKIMLFTDLQLWNSKNNGETFERVWKNYKRIAPRAKLYLFDLAGHGNTPVEMRDNDVFLIAGWSDKVFDVLHAIEQQESALKQIKSIAL